MHKIRNLILRAILLATLLCCLTHRADAQKFSLSTNMLEWANFGTVNVEAGMSLSQHVSLHLGGKYNPWKFNTQSGMPVYNNQTTAYLGCRYWLWYVNSGWWLGARVRYLDFQETGVLRPKLFEGRSVGAGLLFGYTFMLNEHLNLELGGGAWGGRHLEYARYRTVSSRELLDSGARNFFFIDELSLSIMYVF